MSPICMPWKAYKCMIRPVGFVKSLRRKSRSPQRPSRGWLDCLCVQRNDTSVIEGHPPFTEVKLKVPDFLGHFLLRRMESLKMLVLDSGVGNLNAFADRYSFQNFSRCLYHVYMVVQVILYACSPTLVQWIWDVELPEAQCTWDGQRLIAPYYFLSLLSWCYQSQHELPWRRLAPRFGDVHVKYQVTHFVSFGLCS